MPAIFLILLSLSCAQGAAFSAGKISAAASFDDTRLQQALGLTEHYISVNGTRIHYVEKGQGRPIVFLHGFPEFWYSWRHLVTKFPDGYRLILVDLPGFNKSGKPPEEEFYELPRVAALIGELLKAFRLGKVTLVGQDWGGAIAWTLALKYPQQVRELIVMNNPHPGTYAELSKEGRRKFDEATKYIDIFASRKLARSRLQEKNNSILRGIFTKSKYTPDEIETFITAINHQDALSSALNYYRANRKLREVFLNRNPEQKVDWPTYSVKTLLLWGDRDPVSVPALADYTKEYLPPGSRVLHLPESGHFPQTDQPDLVMQEILTFLGA